MKLSSGALIHLSSISAIGTFCEGFAPSRAGMSADDTPRDGDSLHRNKAKAGMYPFSEARKIARGHGFGSVQEFLDYDCPGAYQLPKNPDQVWPNDWRGWDDFLGIILDWEEGRQVARSLNIDSQEEYLTLFQEKKIQDDDVASRLPYRPDLKYKDRWVSWEDFLRHPSE